MEYKDFHMVLIEHLKPSDTMDLVRALREQGLVQGVDFEFKYNPERYIDGLWTNGVTPRGAEFYFRQGKWATWFTLKYGATKPIQSS
jgi:hypothetical protein